MQALDAWTLASTITITDAQWARGLKSQGNQLLLSEYQTIQRGQNWFNRYNLRRIDISNLTAPVQLPTINIPGQLIGTSADNRYAYTVENWWDTGASRNTVRMHALEISGNRAYLRSSTDLDGYVNNVDITGTTAVTTSQWNGEVTRADGTKYWDNKTNLVAIDLSNPRAIHVAGRTQIPMDWGAPAEGEGRPGVHRQRPGRVHVHRLGPGEPQVRGVPPHAGLGAGDHRGGQQGVHAERVVRRADP